MTVESISLGVVLNAGKLSLEITMGRGAHQEIYLDPWYEICLNCCLKECYRDADRDDTTAKVLNNKKKTCPIVIAKKRKWTPERTLSELK